MEQLLSLLNNPLFRKIAIIFGTVSVVILGFTGWLYFHDQAIRTETKDRVDKIWAEKLAQAQSQTTIDTVWQTTPAKPQKPQVKPADVIPSSEHQAKLDSVNKYWESIDANKDSLLRIYTEDRDQQFSDSLQDHIVSFTPLGTFGNPPLSFRLASTAKEQRVPIIHSSNITYLPPEVKWYETRTAFFFYGIITASGIYYIAK